MPDKQIILLTMEQALDAVCYDFQQYEPQILLFCEIIRLISDGKLVIRGDTQKRGAWVSTPGRTNMRWLDGSDLVRHMCQTLGETNWTPGLLAAVCRRVFQTKAEAVADPENGRWGIRIHTGMEDFRCRQCGQCCRTLDYHDQLTAEDVASWQACQQTEILDWVGVFRGEGGQAVYRMWVKPGTTQLVETCPFLHQVASQNRWECRIHQVKPGICRNYPVSRKHALMTGCPGFGTRKG